MKSIQLKKFAASTIAAAALFTAAVPAEAVGTVSTNFNVDITLSPLCSVSTPAPLAFTYISFQPAAAVATTPFTVTCPNGMPYTVGVSAGATDNAVNLAYSLVTSAAGGTGSGVAQNYAVNGTIAAGQGGSCTTVPCTNALATNNVQTITVAY